MTVKNKKIKHTPLWMISNPDIASVFFLLIHTVQRWDADAIRLALYWVLLPLHQQQSWVVDHKKIVRFVGKSKRDMRNSTT